MKGPMFVVNEKVNGELAPESVRDDVIVNPLAGLLGTRSDCKYIKKRLLGQGSFGSAWRVEESATGRVLAAKVMNLNSMSEKDRGFVMNEAKCLSRCHNPHIIRCEDSVEKDGMLLIVMEYADGGDLYKQIKAREQSKRYFQEHEVTFIFLQLCLALDHIHESKMMHRDLKTANILLTTTGLIKLGDFGFSRQYEDSLSNPVGTTFCGTPYYLSPELWHRQPYSKKSEMWALGVVLYEVMALKRPFGGCNMDALINNICCARRDPLPSTFSWELRSICDQLLSVDPSQRPSVRRLFENSFIHNSLLRLQCSVEQHSRIPVDVRRDISQCVSRVLSSEPKCCESAKTTRLMGMALRHATDGKWQPCKLILDAGSITIKDAATGAVEVVPLPKITSVCSIDEHSPGGRLVFAFKNVSGKAFWFWVREEKAYREWLSALQDLSP